MTSIVTDAAAARIRARYGSDAEIIRLFGSYARNEPHTESDIDILVVFSSPFDRYQRIKELVDESIALLDEFGVWVSFTSMTVDRYRADDSALASVVKSEGIEL